MENHQARFSTSLLLFFLLTYLPISAALCFFTLLSLTYPPHRRPSPLFPRQTPPSSPTVIFRSRCVFSAAWQEASRSPPPNLGILWQLRELVEGLELLIYKHTQSRMLSHSGCHYTHMEKVHCLSVNPQTTNIIVLLISPIGWTEGFPNWGHLSKLVKAGERLQDMRPELQSLVLKSVVVHASMLPEPETFDSNISSSDIKHKINMGYYKPFFWRGQSDFTVPPQFNKRKTSLTFVQMWRISKL